MKWSGGDRSTELALLNAAESRPVGLHAYVRADSRAPVWLQLCWLWCRRAVGKL